MIRAARIAAWLLLAAPGLAGLAGLTGAAAAEEGGCGTRVRVTGAPAEVVAPVLRARLAGRGVEVAEEAAAVVVTLPPGMAPATAEPYLRAPGHLRLRDPDGTVLTDRMGLSGAEATDRFGEPGLVLTLDRTGRAAFAEITAERIGRPVELVLDGQVLIAPVVREAISGGQVVISGGFGWAELDLVATLAAAPFPDPVPLPLTVEVVGEAPCESAN